MLPKPEHCRTCPLFGNGQGFSNIEGSGDSGLLVLAEALGEHEEAEGLPLRPSAPAGAVFHRALRDAGIPRNALVITNCVRCRPPDNELRGTPYERVVLDHCAHYLDGVVERYKPRAILTLGDIPLRELTDYSGVLTYRGFIYKSRYGIPVVPTYHPSFLARGALGKLFGVFRTDVNTALKVARSGVPKLLETHYELNPSVGRVREYLDYLRANPLLPIAYDVETAAILGEKEPDDWRRKRLVQIQFSHRPGYAIVLPWWGPFPALARSILELPNPKWGWNSRSSDDIVLVANGIKVGSYGAGASLCVAGTGHDVGARSVEQTDSVLGNSGAGEAHDLMLAWQHLHPDFASQKDSKGDASGSGQRDKDIVARLMGLQSALSFFHPEVGPWKHRSDDLQLYGAMDADYTVRCGLGIFAALEKQGLMEGYRRHKYELRKVFDDMGARGLPINRNKQAEVRVYCAEELARMRGEIQALVPAELRGIHPEGGYKTLPKKVKQLIESYDIDNPPLLEFSNFSGHLYRGQFEITPDNLVGETRWYVRKLFNVGSSQQLLSYIKHRGYRVPKRIDDPSKDTTGKDELAKLAKETKDPLLVLTDTYRKFAKMAGSYTGKEVKAADGSVQVIGDWVPGPDGCVHPEFGWGTGSGQSSCNSPNAQQFPEHGPLAKKAKAMIQAQPGHTFVKRDMRGFHSRAIGFLAEDRAYYDLADSDVHSFITAHFRKLPDAPFMLEMSDDELRGYLKTVKQDYEFDRNYKVKRCVHGRQFNMGVNKLYNMHAPNFDPSPEVVMQTVGFDKWAHWTDEQRAREISRRGRAEAISLFNLFDKLFPKTFITFPRAIENQIRNVSRWHLKSPFGHIRWFWDYDKEQSTAYLPSNCAHCHIQYALIDMDRDGALDKYQLVNFTHDAVWFHCPDQFVSECVEYSARVLEAPSTVMINALGAFQCNSDAEVGRVMTEMRGI